MRRSGRDRPGDRARPDPLSDLGLNFTPDCPPDTDDAFLVSNEPLTPAPGVLDEQAGYACIRNLEPPHPGEPGGGGGLGIVVGDCVSARPSSTGDGEQDIDETRCDGTGTHPPTHQVTSIGTGGLFPTECPPGTDLRFTIASTFSALPTDKLACAAPVASPTG